MVGTACLVPSAAAQEQGRPAGAPAGQPQQSGGDTQTFPSTIAPTAQAPDADNSAASTKTGPQDPQARHLKDLDKLSLKGWETSAPTASNSLSQDVGGWRSALADAGFGLNVYSLNLASYDFARAGKGLSGPQIYNGQKLTVQTSSQSAILTYDLSRIGLEGGQLSAIANLALNGYQSRNGLRGGRIKSIAWHQPILHDKVELDMGYIANITYYMGTTVGGSLSGGALGPQASIPVEAGLSFGNYGAPAFSAKVDWGRNFYTRTGIQRSISPGGSRQEDADNPDGLTFSVPGARPLVVQEFGYRVAADESHKMTWIRAGGIYNFSRYADFDGEGTHRNAMMFAAVDKQVTQPDATTPGRGLYLGLTYNAARGSVDSIDRYYEARAYLRGPFRSRPDDMVSLVAAVNGYSAQVRDANETAGFRPYSTTQTYTAGYDFRVTHGLFLQPGVSVIVHPVYTTQDLGTAVNGMLNLSLFF